MALIPEEIIRSVQDSVDIVDVVGRYVSLRRSGASFKGLCPFHEEKTPSFHVFPTSGRYKCFGCGEGGDVFTFVMKRSNLGFREVLEELAREAGIVLPSEPESPDEAHRRGRRLEALEALRFAQGFFRAVLQRPTGAAGRDYLASRGFTAETIETFGIGFAPDSFQGLLDTARERGIPEQALIEAGLARRNDQGRLYDMFRGRITFPIHDLKGRVIGFGARALGDAEPKYLNSPDGALFHKGREMYGLHLARDAARAAGRLLVVEGYTDVMHCHQAGLGESAAGLGTALTADNARQLRRFGVPVLLVYDGDEAGRRAAERAAEVFLAERVEGGVALLPPGQDPADLIVTSGPSAIEQVLSGAQDLWNYRLERALERQDLSTLEGRERVVRELEGAIARMGDPVRRDLAFKLLAERIGVPESTLRNRIHTGSREGGTRQASPPSGAWLRAERDFIGALLRDPGVWERIEPFYPPERFQDPELGAIAGAARDLRQQAQWVTREALLSALADRDEAVRALLALETDDETVARAEQHIERIAERKRLEEALAAREDPLAAVLAARRARQGTEQRGDGAK